MVVVIYIKVYFMYKCNHQSVSVPRNMIWLRKCNDVSPSSYLRQAQIVSGTASQCSLVRTSTAVTLGLLIRLCEDYYVIAGLWLTGIVGSVRGNVVPVLVYRTYGMPV